MQKDMNRLPDSLSVYLTESQNILKQGLTLLRDLQLDYTNDVDFHEWLYCCGGVDAYINVASYLMDEFTVKLEGMKGRSRRNKKGKGRVGKHKA